jgi:hypothetical protein
VFGGVGRTFLFAVHDRSAETLIGIIKQLILPFLCTMLDSEKKKLFARSRCAHLYTMFSGWNIRTEVKATCWAEIDEAMYEDLEHSFFLHQKRERLVHFSLCKTKIVKFTEVSVLKNVVCSGFFL